MFTAGLCYQVNESKSLAESRKLNNLDNSEQAGKAKHLQLNLNSVLELYDAVSDGQYYCIRFGIRTKLQKTIILQI